MGALGVMGEIAVNRKICVFCRPVPHINEQCNSLIGTCEISPRNGSALTTTFHFACTGWQDPDLPLRYEFASYNKESTMSVIYTGKYSSTTAFLPLGDENKNFTLVIRARVIDALGSATEQNFSVKVRRSIKV